MPRRIYTYDANQGWEMFNQMATVGRVPARRRHAALRLQLVQQHARRARSPATIRGARATLEWSIPSPPPDYNFAVLPTVTSRTPLWGDDPGPGPATVSRARRATPRRPRPPPQLRIPMPTPTIKPLVAALGLGVMFTGCSSGTRTCSRHAHSAPRSSSASLYTWLLTPLEPEHH